MSGAALLAVAATLVTIGGDVQVTLPPGVHYAPGQGTDSNVGTFSAPGLVCTHDLGAFSNPLTGIEGAVRTKTTISGHAAFRVKAPTGVDGLYVPELSRSVLGANALTLYCKSSTAQARELARALLDGVSLPGK